jgi:hypothetical protein
MTDLKPEIKINLSAGDRLGEIAGWLSLATLWIVTAYTVYHSPDIVPIHYNREGVDGYGAKETLFVLPVLITAMAIFLTIVNKKPHTFNYAVTITPANALRQYTLATRLVRYLKIVLPLAFSILTVSPGKWALVIILGSVLLPLFYTLIKSSSEE